jgi:DNA polymerase-1
MSHALCLVDGYSIIYRGYFAFLKKPLLNPEGRNSSSVFVFFRTLFELVRERSPGFLAVAMDSRVPTFRHARFPEYKANREKAPPDLHAQVPVIEEILAALGVPCLRADGYEADDVIATLAEQCHQSRRPCWIFSGDKDILQLIGGNVRLLAQASARRRPRSCSRFTAHSTRSTRGWNRSPLMVCAGSWPRAGIRPS